MSKRINRSKQQVSIQELEIGAAQSADTRWPKRPFGRRGQLGDKGDNSGPSRPQLNTLQIGADWAKTTRDRAPAGPLIPALVPQAGQTFTVMTEETGVIDPNAYVWSMISMIANGTVVPIKKKFAKLDAQIFGASVEQVRAETAGWNTIHVRNNRNQGLFITRLSKYRSDLTRWSYSYRITHPTTQQVLFTINKDVVGAGYPWSSDTKEEWRVYRGHKGQGEQVYYCIARIGAAATETEHTCYHKSSSEQPISTSSFSTVQDHLTKRSRIAIALTVKEGEDTALLLATSTIIHNLHKQKRQASEMKAQLEKQLEKAKSKYDDTDKLQISAEEEGPLMPALVAQAGQTVTVMTKETGVSQLGNAYAWSLISDSTTQTNGTQRSRQFAKLDTQVLGAAPDQIALGQLWNTYHARNNRLQALFNLRFSKSRANSTRWSYSYRITHPTTDLVLFTIEKDWVGAGYPWSSHSGEEWRVYRGREGEQLYYCVANHKDIEDIKDIKDIMEDHKCYHKSSSEQPISTSSFSVLQDRFTKKSRNAITLTVKEGGDAALLLATSTAIYNTHKQKLQFANLMELTQTQIYKDMHKYDDY